MYLTSFMFIQECTVAASASDLSAPSTSSASTSTPTISQRKLSLFRTHSSCTSESAADSSITDTEAPSYTIIEVNILKDMLRSMACPHCSQTDCDLSEETVFGMTVKFKLQCTSCSEILFSNFTSPVLSSTDKSYDINQRLVFATKANGIGYQQASSFMAHLNLPLPISDTAYNNKLGSLANSCKKALREHLTLVHQIVRKQYISDGLASADTDVIDISVSYDGTWQKRGHTSHNGIGVAIDMHTGYVVDFEVLSNICVTCEREQPKEETKNLKELQGFLKRHAPHCDKNYDGTSNGMEVEAAKRIWGRSAETSLHYTTMLSDGDSKAYTAVCELAPYGEKLIKKEECVNHVSKRLAAALEALKSKGGPKGMPLGGRGMLTKNTIALLKSYYHNAISKNAGDIDGMKKEILAAPYHVTSTDAEPDHRYCPKDSWCWYYTNPNRPEGHQPDLPKQLLPIILPVYEKLSSNDLLERCARVSTQNANECLNGTIWRRCPKTQWLGRRSVMIGATMGVMVFNNGEEELLRIAREFSIRPSPTTTRHSEKRDEARTKRQIVSTSKRRSRAHRLQTERQRQIRKEGVTYASGKF